MRAIFVMCMELLKLLVVAMERDLESLLSQRVRWRLSILTRLFFQSEINYLEVMQQMTKLP